jgi:hypothetical protein
MELRPEAVPFHLKEPVRGARMAHGLG